MPLDAARLRSGAGDHRAAPRDQQAGFGCRPARWTRAEGMSERLSICSSGSAPRNVTMTARALLQMCHTQSMA